MRSQPCPVWWLRMQCLLNFVNLAVPACVRCSVSGLSPVYPGLLDILPLARHHVQAMRFAYARMGAACPCTMQQEGRQPDMLTQWCEQVCGLCAAEQDGHAEGGAAGLPGRHYQVAQPARQGALPASFLIRLIFAGMRQHIALLLQRLPLQCLHVLPCLPFADTGVVGLVQDRAYGVARGVCRASMCCTADFQAIFVTHPTVLHCLDSSGNSIR